MPETKTRVYDYRSGLPGDDIRLGVVDKKIKSGAAQLEKELSANSGITLERLHELLATHSIEELDTSIKQWGPAFESHLGQVDPDKPEDSRVPGWYVEWEEAKEKREERIEEIIHGGV